MVALARCGEHAEAACSRRRGGELSFCPNESAVISKRDRSCCSNKPAVR